jgi:hypothetical protein
VEWAGSYEQPKSRASVAVSLERGPWRTSLTYNYTAGYERALTALGPALSVGFDHPRVVQHQVVVDV